MGVNSSLEPTIANIQKRLARKWMLIFIFAGILSFFVWLVWINAMSIWKSYQIYKQNVATQDAVNNTVMSDTTPTAADDETYDGDTNNTQNSSDMDNPKIDNATITTNIDNLKNLYKPYNDLLIKQKDTQDVVDEKILDPEYDEYNYGRD